jgi:hypothetical protein
MATGERAFQRKTGVETLAAILREEPKPIAERNPAAPAPLRWTIERCLAKEREGRYESTRDLARELAQLRDHYDELTGTGMAAVQTAPPARVRASRWPIAACVLAAAVAWCVAEWLHNLSAIDLTRYHPRPFATAMPSQVWPVWSPDGKSIAFFGARESMPQQVYVQAIDAPTAVAITTGDASVYSFCPLFWSADSHAVYFPCTKAGVFGLCRAPAGGGATAMVQPNARVGSLSPDGQTLAMLTGEGFGLRLMTASPPEAPPRVYEPQPLPKEISITTRE